MNARWQILGIAASVLIAGSLIWALAVSRPSGEGAPVARSSANPAPPSRLTGSAPEDQTQLAAGERNAGAASPAPEEPATGVAAAETPAAETLAAQAEPDEPDEPEKPRQAEPSQPAPSKPTSEAKDPLAMYPAGEIPQDQEQTYEDIWARPIPVPPEAKGLKRLTKDNGVWVDPKRRRVVIAGRVVCRRGPLEMFACPRQTKEHESVVAVNTKAFVVHAALLALGVEPGRPVQFDPEYRPAQGPEIRVLVCWNDPQGRRRCVPAQKWVRNVKTNKEMQHPWLFTGSQWWESPDGKQRYYMAEQGDFICVSNFPTAMLDLPIRSSNAASALLFAAFTERIPPLGTDVALILEPVKPAPPGKKQP